MRTIIEPFKIKMVEPIRATTPEERAGILRKAHYNPFLIHSEDILLDLLTDSGTSAMSAAQWGAMMVADESYACSRSFFKFEKVVRALTGFKNIIPTHQGRAAERILFEIVGGKGKVVPSNNHFDTTRANIEYSGADAVDLVIDEGKIPSSEHPFKGNIDIGKLEALIERVGADSVPLGMLTVTNNTGGGQPVSMENIRAVSETLHRYNIPFFLDACRFAENAYFIKRREAGYAEKSAREIAQEMFSYCDGATFSGKKDGLSNIGGFLAMNDDRLAEQARNLLILTEGFPTYGGLAARDLEALAVGLEEVLDERYLEYRHACIEYFARKIVSGGVKIVEPPGGHALYIDARAFLPQLPIEQYPGQALVCALYEIGGVRGVEVGSAMFGKHDPETGDETYAAMDLVRLAIPRRVYTQSHVDYLAEVILETFDRRESIQGLKIAYQAPFLRHFTAHFAPAA
ncbi:MAG TPA: tryptophanase [Chthonomonadaceae bacterium]|nr:tryptophanase [Chthonomonadaceae bacterium]